MEGVRQIEVTKEILYEYFLRLKEEADKLGYYTSHNTHDDKSCHEPHFIIFIQKPNEIQNIYNYAHEIGHCIEYKSGKFDFNKYVKNKKYRQYKESTAWMLGYRMCLKLKIPIDGYWKQAYDCYKSYL